MRMMGSRTRSRAALLAFALVLAGCAGAPVGGPSGATETGAAQSTSAVGGPSRPIEETPGRKKSRLKPLLQEGAGAPTPELVQRHTEALALLEGERYDEAAAVLREIVATAPALIAPRINLSLACARAGRLEEAQSILEEAVVLAPQNAAAQTQLGVVYRMRGQLESAERGYLAALAADPQHANAHYDLGILYDLYLQRPADAIAHYEQYQALAGAEDEQVQKWIADLGRRSGETKTAEVVEE